MFNKNLIIIVLMGVSGSGKTTIGKILSKEKSIKYAKKNKWCYVDSVVEQ